MSADPPDISCGQTNIHTDGRSGKKNCRGRYAPKYKILHVLLINKAIRHMKLNEYKKITERTKSASVCNLLLRSSRDCGVNGIMSSFLLSSFPRNILCFVSLCRLRMYHGFIVVVYAIFFGSTFLWHY